MHGVDVLPRRRTVAKRVPQQRDGAMQDARGDVPMAPYRIEDVVVGQGLARVAGQQHQHGEGLGLERDIAAGYDQTMGRHVDLDVIEDDRDWFVRQRHDPAPRTCLRMPPRAGVA